MNLPRQRSLPHNEKRRPVRAAFLTEKRYFFGSTAYFLCEMQEEIEDQAMQRVEGVAEILKRLGVAALTSAV